MVNVSDTDERIAGLQKTYRKLMMIGLATLLAAFALLILRPFGSASLVLGAILFPVAMIPLELARRTAQRMALIALGGVDRKA
ncbi:hypothetical protein [Thermococcus gammatolerans]|uniref:hypothetical protein n=1 Tax=Thermococcus gammatolerans TaxID=187878 RepID=UPI001EE633A7|nr:hypothetical protein [Thermococcus gammatolerans]